jgi:hypothetical protein
MRAARGRLERAKLRARNHGQTCWECHSAGDRYERFCDTGFRLAQSISRANHDIWKLSEAASDELVQGGLF